MGWKKHRGKKKKGCLGCVFPVMIFIFLLEVFVLSGLMGEKIKDSISDKVLEYFEPEVPYQEVQIDQKELLKKYYYEQLSEEERTAYTEISQGIRDQEDEIYVHASDAKRTNRILEYVLKDSPEIFWCDGTAKTTSYEGKDNYTVLRPVYLYEREEREKRQSEIDCEVSECLSKVGEDDSDYDKILYVFEYIVNTVEYDAAAEDNQNIYSVFVGKKSVCAGYSKATQYLLEKMGIFCTYVTGTTKNGENHAWNLVICEGDYYYVDTTWGDPVFLNETEDADNNYISYDYMCCDDEALFKTHVPNAEVKLPECSKMDYNYYVVNHMYYEECDSNRMLADMNEIISKKEKMSVFKFPDEKIYQEGKHEIFGNLLERTAKNLAQWYQLERVNYTYIDDSELNKIVIYWEYE